MEGEEGDELPLQTGDARPRGDNDEEGQERREREEEDAQAVDADVVGDVERRYPRAPLGELEGGGRGVLAGDGEEGERELEGGAERGDAPEPAGVLDKEERGRNGEGEEDQDRQDWESYRRNFEDLIHGRLSRDRPRESGR